MNATPTNGLGIDFGATACRAGIAVDGECRSLPEGVSVPGERAVFTTAPERVLQLDPDDAAAGSVAHWIRQETAKAGLGLAARLQGAKGHSADGFEAQVVSQLGLLRENLENHLQAEVLGAVVGAPACYGMNQRVALRTAAEAAGFGTVALLDESVAAALFVYRERATRGHVLVYCLGRSMFAASVVRVGDGPPQALNHEGSTQLGGQDVESFIALEVAHTLLQERDVKITSDRAAMRQLIDRAEQVKLALVTEEEARLEVGPGRDSAGQPFHTYLNVSSAALADMARPLVAHTLALSRKAVRGAGLQAEDLAEVLLVGEATHLLLVEQEVRQAFGKPIVHAAPDAIACGAAMYAATLHNCFRPRTADETAVATRAVPVPATVAPPTAAATVVPAQPGPRDEEPEDALLAALLGIRRTLKTGDLDASISAFELFLRQAREELSYLYSKRASEFRQEGQIGPGASSPGERAGPLGRQRTPPPGAGRPVGDPRAAVGSDAALPEGKGVPAQVPQARRQESEGTAVA